MRNIGPFELTAGIGLHFSAYLSLPTKSPTVIAPVEQSVFPLKKVTEGVNEEPREKANRLGYDRLKEPPEGVSEEQEKKTQLERIADALHAIGFFLHVASGVVGFCIFLFTEKESAGFEELRLPLTVWGFGFLAWLYCRAARFVLVDVTSDMQKEKPNVAGRIGQVIYWLGCAVGILSMPVGVVVCLIEFIEVGQRKYYSFDPLQALLVCLASLAIGAAAWLVGRAARYILKGD